MPHICCYFKVGYITLFKCRSHLRVHLVFVHMSEFNKPINDCNKKGQFSYNFWDVHLTMMNYQNKWQLVTFIKVYSHDCLIILKPYRPYWKTLYLYIWKVVTLCARRTAFEMTFYGSTYLKGFNTQQTVGNSSKTNLLLYSYEIYFSSVSCNR